GPVLRSSSPVIFSVTPAPVARWAILNSVGRTMPHPRQSAVVILHRIDGAEGTMKDDGGRVVSGRAGLEGGERPGQGLGDFGGGPSGHIAQGVLEPLEPEAPVLDAHGIG